MARLALKYENKFQPKWGADAPGGGSGYKRDDRLIERLSYHQLLYSLVGLAVSLVCVIGGVVLFIAGVVGSTSWVASLLGMQSKITDAAPGAVLFIVGVFVALITRLSISIRR